MYTFSAVTTGLPDAAGKCLQCLPDGSPGGVHPGAAVSRPHRALLGSGASAAGPGPGPGTQWRTRLCAEETECCRHPPAPLCGEAGDYAGMLCLFEV